MRITHYLTFIFVFFILISISFLTATSYGSGPYGSGEYGIGYTAPAATVVPGGGEGGRECSYNWDCTNWFPSECPVEGIQERICANRGTCSGKGKMPNQIQNCTYKHKEPLFDILLKISEYQRICAGGKIKANIKLENYGKLELLDAFMTYWIIDENNKLISEVKDTRNVADKLNFGISIKIPESILPGTYKLYVQMTYSKNKTAVAGDSFKIMEKDSCGIFPGFLLNLFIFIIVGFLIFIILVIFLARKFSYLRERRGKVKDKKEKIEEESYYTPLFDK